MTVPDLPFGSISEFEFIAQPPLPPALIPNREVQLRMLDSGEVVLVIPGDANEIIPVEIAAGAQKQELRAMFLSGRPRICWVMGGSGERLFVRIHEFLSKLVWPQPLELALAEQALDDFRKRFHHPHASSQEIKRTLIDRLVLPPATPEGAPRFFVSAGVADFGPALGAFRLHGRETSLDAHQDESGKLVVKRLIARARGDLGRITLIEGDLQFRDVTVASQLADEARTQLDAIVNGANSYLDIWRTYSEFEKNRLAKMAQEVGVYRYERYDETLENSFRFHVAGPAPGQLQKLLELCQGEGQTLEASSVRPPEDFGDRATMSGDEFVGRCTPKRIDLGGNFIELSKESFSPNPAPPTRGFISLSTYGARVSIKRRDKAAEAIRRADCPMPQLGLLIEGQPVPVGKWRWEEPMTSRVRARFNSEPTRVQKMAIDIAINTPDIAIIQGPPGTGKTQVISAIVKRLEELADPHRPTSGLFLLTSFQHVAVDNVSERVMAYGLPPMKFGRGRKQADDATSVIVRWRSKASKHIAEQLKSYPENDRLNAYRELESLADSYNTGHRTPLEMADLLDRAHQLSEGLVLGSQRDELRALAAKIRNQDGAAGAASRSARIEAYRAVLSLRQSETGFADDGPARAADVRETLRRVEIELNPDARKLLDQASIWHGAGAPAFLGQLRELRDDLIRKLAPDDRPRAIREAPREEVNDKLAAILETAERTLRNSGDGVAMLLEEFRYGLKYEPDEVEAAISQYTAVIAETCQGVARKEIHNIQERWPQPGFENVIVDEAARANPLDLFIPMTQARRRIILVGDQNQLPHNLEPVLEKEMLEEKSDPVERGASQEILVRAIVRAVGGVGEKRRRKAHHHARYPVPHASALRRFCQSQFLRRQTEIRSGGGAFQSRPRLS